MNSWYGNYRTKSLGEIFRTYDNFLEEWQNTSFNDVVGEELTSSMPLIYDLLLAKYVNSCIANSDESQFKLQLFSIIFNYAPTWQKQITIQKEVRKLTAEELRTTGAGANITNLADNPSQQPGTNSTNELPYITQQSVTKSKRNLADTYATLNSLLNDDYTDKFLNRFKKLFLTLVAPTGPLWYESEDGEGYEDVEVNEQ